MSSQGQIPRDEGPSQSLKKPKLYKAKEDLHTGQPVMAQDPQSKTWDEGVVTSVRDEPQGYDVQVGKGECKRS